MKLINTLLMVALIASPVAACASESVNHSGQASKHSVMALGHGLHAGVKVASTAVAAPVAIVGSASVAAGSVLTESAKSLSYKPHSPKSKKIKSKAALEVSETTVTVGPAPNQAVQRSN
ncbi:hypothetical protein [uncultured Pseudoteredinibacter sp.]|uniref:hypothetical protein n=1 Tax=uncultured Pseudoteredinibacter sp. TaxID=1641701 RepID=UPI0026036961|nr:hypothetical protein [uncultured Pseudoteredinibacter sp.]